MVAGMRTPRTPPLVRPWSRFADGVLSVLIGHVAMLAYGVLQYGAEAVVPFGWLLLGAVQLFYVVPLALAFALTGRVGAVVGVGALALMTAAPMLLVTATGGIKVLPF